MKGNLEYNQKKRNKLNNMLEKNKEKEYLVGFSNYLLTFCSYYTACMYTYYVVRFMNVINKEPEFLSIDDYTQFISSLKDYVSSYQINMYTALKWFSEYLFTRKINKENSMQFVKRPKFKETDETQRKRSVGFLTQEETIKYKENVSTGKCLSENTRKRTEKWRERDIAIVSILSNTGMRCSALYRIDVSSIDFKKNEIRVIEKEGNGILYKISDSTMNDITNWLNKRKNILDGIEENALFISNQKSRMDQTSIWRVIKKYGKCIDGKEISPHKFRSTYGTQIYKGSGGNLLLTQSCMHHQSPKTTEIYIRGVENEFLDESVKIMENFLGGVCDE